MVNIDLSAATIASTSRLLEQRLLSPVELIGDVLDRISVLDKKLHSYTTITSDYAMERARNAEKEISQGDYIGPLHGIPYSLKDLIDTEGIRTTYGYKSHQDFVPSSSATVHRRLEAAGAILVGKTDCHFRRGGVMVKCLNPWDISRSPGRSSSGSGVSLATSMCLASVGSDTGGSIRLPAAWTGVVGLRATFGLIPRIGTLGPSWSYDQVGPMAKNVYDSALILQAIAGHDSDDSVSLNCKIPDYSRIIGENIEGVRIGIIKRPPDEEPEEEVGIAFNRALEVLMDLGANIVEVTIPSASNAPRAYEIISGAESALSYPQTFSKERLNNIDDDTKQYLENASRYTLTDYLTAHRNTLFLRNDVDRVFDEVDVVVSPTSLTPALSTSEILNSALEAPTGLTESASRPREILHMATYIASICGLPGLSVPCGFTKDSLPIGLHIMGRKLDETLVLRVGYNYEQANNWHLFHPKLEEI